MENNNNNNGQGFNILNMGDTASEVDVTGAPTGEVIDPKEVAEQAAAEETTEDIKDETNLEPTDDTDDTSSADDNDDDSSTEGTDDTSTGDAGSDGAEDSKEQEEEVETFKVLGKHFSDAGIIDGYDDEMENSEEAFQSMIEKTIENGINQYKESFNNPLTKQFVDYLENGGNAGDFMQLVQGPDYSAIDADGLAENEAAQKQVLQAYLIENGESVDEANETIQAFEDAGSLGKKAASALSKLQASQNKKREEALLTQKQKADEHRKSVQEYVTNLETNINSKEEIAGFKLTKKTKSDLFNYITAVDKTGETQLMKDAKDPDKQLLMAFFHFNDFNFDKLEKKSKSKATNDLMSKLSRTTDTSKKQTTRTRTKTSKDEPGANLGVMKNLLKKGKL